MLRTILLHGAIAGFVAGLPLSLAVITSPDAMATNTGMALGYLAMLLGFVALFLGIKRQRDANGGRIGFWRALGIGLAISVVAGLVYVAMWETVQAVSGFDFASEYGRIMLDQARSGGAGPEQLAAVERDVAQFRAQYADPLFRLPMSFAEIFPVGALVSLIAAGVLSLRRPRSAAR